MRPEKPQLLHLVALPKERRSDAVAFPHPAPEHGHVGHDPSVVVEARVEHQRFEDVVLRGRRPAVDQDEKDKCELSPGYTHTHSLPGLQQYEQ